MPDKFRQSLSYFLDTGQQVTVTVDYYRLATERLALGGFDIVADQVGCDIILHRNELKPRQVAVKLPDSGDILNTIVKDLDTYQQLRNNPVQDLGRIVRAYGEDYFLVDNPNI